MKTFIWSSICFVGELQGILLIIQTIVGSSAIFYIYWWTLKVRKIFYNYMTYINSTIIVFMSLNHWGTIKFLPKYSQKIILTYYMKISPRLMLFNIILIMKIKVIIRRDIQCNNLLTFLLFILAILFKKTLSYLEK